MNDFGFGTSRCVYCGHLAYRKFMEFGEEGWYQPRCKEDNIRSLRETIIDTESFLEQHRGRIYAEKKAF